MAKSKQKYYVVWEGHNTGIFSSWADCQVQIKAYPNAKYKSFESLEEAEEAFHGQSYSSHAKSSSKNKLKDWKTIVPQGSIAVDAACAGNPGDMEYRGVDPFTGMVIFHIGPKKNGTNNIGEFLAIVHALALLKKAGNSTAAIYTDSKTALSWIRRKTANTKLEFNASNLEIRDLLVRAQHWLHSNSYSNPICKWETEEWGEIPADFGRK